MRVLLTIWISAVLIQEVIPGTLVRLPRHTPKRPALVQTEYEGKYEQKGQNGNENSGLFSGKHQIVHHDCAENWNDFAEKCAALVKDLVASLANTVSSRPGDATKLQLQIKNTFKHFDSTHNLTCLNDKGKSNPKFDLSCLFNNITISTVAPTMNSNTNSTGANNKKEGRNCRNGQSHNGENGSDLREGVIGTGSSGDGDDGDGCSDGDDNNIGTQYSHPAGVSRKPNTAIDHATAFSPENDEDPDIGINSRRPAEYPQVSWQPGNKTGHSNINQGRSNNISRSPYPFIVTPQPNSVYGSPVPASYSDSNNLANGRNGFDSIGQTNSNGSPAGASGQSGTPLKTQTLPPTNEPASDTHYNTGVPATGSPNSAYPTVLGVPSAFDDRRDPALVPTGPGDHSSKNGFTLPKAPVTEDSYDPNPFPIKPTTDSQPGTAQSTRFPKFPKKNSPESRDWTKDPELALSTSTDQTTEYPQSSDPHSLSNNQLNRPVPDIIRPVSSATPQDSRLGAIPWTPSTKPVLTTDKPEGFSAQEDKKLGFPVINSDSNIPEWWGPESQMGTTKPLPTGRNPNPPSAASINHESEPTTFTPTTNKFSGTITPPLDHVPPSVFVEPTLPEADNHRSEDPLDPGHVLNNPTDQSAPVTGKPSFLSQNFDHLGGSSSENMDGKPKRGAPVTVHSVLMPTTMSPLGSNTDEKPEENSGSNGNDNSGKSTTEEDDCEEDDAEDAGKVPATVPQSSGHSLQGTGIPQSNVEEGNSSVKNGIGQSPASGSGSNSNTNPDSEEYEDCDENTDSDSAINAGTANQATTPVVPPVQSAPKKSDPISPGSAPVSDNGGENTGSSNDPNSMTHSGSNTGTTNEATSLITASPGQSIPHPAAQETQGNAPATDDYEDCDEFTESSTDVTTPVAVSPVQPVPKVSDLAVPALDHGGENLGSSIDRNSVPVTGSNTETANEAIAPVAMSPVKPATMKSDSVRGSAPVSDNGQSTGTNINSNSVPHGGSETGSSTIPNSMPHSISNTGIAKDVTTPVTAFPIQSLSTVPEPVEHGNVPDPADYEDRDENAESSNDATAPVPVSPKLVPNTPDTSSNTGIVNHGTNPVPVLVSPVKSVQSDPTVQGNIPAFDGDGENTGSSSYPDSASHFSSGTGATDYLSNVPVNQATTPVPVPESPVKSVQSDPAVQGNIPASDGDGENTGSSSYPDSASHFSSGTGATDYLSNVPVNQATTPVPVPESPVKPVQSDPAVQGNFPAHDDGGENTGSSTYPNSVPVSSSNTETANHGISPVPVSSVKPEPEVLHPAVQGNIPAYDDGGENSGSSSHPNSVPVTSSNTETANHANTPVPVSVPVSPVKPVQSDPAVQGNVPGSDGVDENAGPGTYPDSASHFSSSTVATDYPNGVSHSSSNTGTANDATTPVAESLKPSSTVSDPAGQSLQSGDKPLSETIPEVDGDQSGNSQSTPLSATPSPHVYSPFGYTTISTSSEGQSHDPENEDSALYKPTTFQTTAADPTSPQSILIPTESTGGLIKVPAPSHSSVGDDDDEDDEEDCCSCESCTEEITDPKQYKENACKNLEEARKELKAIFDKIKKKLKCGRKACSHTIGQISSGKETSVMG